MDQAMIDTEGLGALIRALVADGYRVIGPTVSGDAIVLAEITDAAQLPAGWGVETGPGCYRLQQRDDGAMFAHSAGPQSWKTFLHPARRKLWSADAGGSVPAGRRGPTPVCATRRPRLRPGRDRQSCTGCSPAATTRTRPSRHDTGRRSSSRPSAPNPVRRASAPPWAPVPQPTRAPTWPSPSSRRAGTVSLYAPGLTPVATARACPAPHAAPDEAATRAARRGGGGPDGRRAPGRPAGR